MNVLAGHDPVKRGGVGHAFRSDPVGDAPDNEIGGLERAVRLFREDQANRAQAVLFVEQFVFAEVQKKGGIHREQQQNQDRRADIKEPKRSKAWL